MLPVLAMRACRSSRVMRVGNGSPGSSYRTTPSKPHVPVTDLARRRRHPDWPRSVSVPLMAVEFGILGPLEVRAAAGAVPIRRGLPRTLLIALLLRPGQTVSSDFLVDLLWGATSLPRNPANALQIQVSYLRKTLASAEPDGAGRCWRRAPAATRCVVEPDRIDAHRFESSVKHVHAAGRVALEAALQRTRWTRSTPRWRCGEATRSRTSPAWSSPAARSPDSTSCAGRRRNAGSTCCFVSGATATRSGDLSELVQRMPLRERFHEQLVLALYRSGRQAEALRAYEHARRTLVEELGLDPGAELRDLERRVLQQDPSLDWVATGRAGRRATRPREPRDAPAAVRDVAGRVPVPLSPLIGRDAELARLDRAAGAPPGGDADRPGRRGQDPPWPSSSPAAAPTPSCVRRLQPDRRPGLVGADGALRQRGWRSLRATTRSQAIADDARGPDVLLGAGHLRARRRPPRPSSPPAVLRAAPGVRVLATSRRALGLSGEFAWPVPPLDAATADAAQRGEITLARRGARCSSTRAHAVRPDLEIDDAAAADIAAVCLALDGLPLAIELAAARTDVLSPAAIRARLAGPLRAARRRRRRRRPAATDAASGDRLELRAAVRRAAHVLRPPRHVRRHVRPRRRAPVAGAGLADATGAAGVTGEAVDGRPGRSRPIPAARHACAPTPWTSSPNSTPTRPATATPTSTSSSPSSGEVAIRGADQLEWLDRFRSDINNFRAALEWCAAHRRHRPRRPSGRRVGLVLDAQRHAHRSDPAPRTARRDRRRARRPIRGQVPVGLRPARRVARADWRPPATPAIAPPSWPARRRPPAPPTASTPPPSPSGRSATTSGHSAHREAIELLDQARRPLGAGRVQRAPGPHALRPRRPRRRGGRPPGRRARPPRR